MSGNRGPKKKRWNRTDRLVGFCGSCGKRYSLHMRVWQEARRRDLWPVCDECEDWVYPQKRTCRICKAVLRSTNLTDLCALCMRKRIADPNDNLR